MGLDMMIYKDSAGVKDMQSFDAVYEDLPEYAYWRKASMIHRFFATHGKYLEQNDWEQTALYRIKREDLIYLLKICTYFVSNTNLVKKEAKDILPYQSDFFSGSADYDDDYIYKLYVTIENIGKILRISAGKYSEKENEQTFLYYTSW